MNFSLVTATLNFSTVKPDTADRAEKGLVGHFLMQTCRRRITTHRQLAEHITLTLRK